MVYVVRHGEKLDDSKDPPLSVAGQERAARLARMLAASGVRGIYTTQYQRTILHAAPVARALNVTPIVHPAADTPGLAKKIAAYGADEVVLVVGHGNTVPEILKALGHSNPVKIDETEFDNLFVLVPGIKAPVVVRLKY
ncbi:MAG: histidine phosphatase family protein [Betaproteobacteria bacterium]|nr:histidine phosphatase family protein [Betaproteobacteria bacterium]